jgi:predicted transcriptional regulator
VVLAVLWNAHEPLTAAQITARLGGGSPARTGHALSQLHRAGLAVPARDRRACRWRPVQSRDGYLTDLVAAALGQAGDPNAVLRAVLGLPAPL